MNDVLPTTPLWTTDCFSAGDEVGISLTDFGNALQCWSMMQQARPTSVAEAALAFNTTPEIIRQAVQEHYWMELGPEDAPPDQQFIEHDGE